MDHDIRCIGRCFAVLVLLGLKTSQCLYLEPSYPSIASCANSSLEVTCTSSTSVLRWTFTNYQGNASFSLLFTTFLVNEVAMMGDLVLRVVSQNPLRSTVTFEPLRLKHSGSILTCSNTSTPIPMPQDFTSITILVKEPPSMLLKPEFIPLSLDSAVLSWTSPTDSSCVTGYAITLINITEGSMSYHFYTTSSTTSTAVSDLTQGAEYSFTVAGIDAGDRFGEESVPSNAVVLDTPEAVIMLEYEHLYIDNSLVRVTLKWMPSPPSTRPPVIGYTVSHNSSKTVLVNETSDTEFVVELRVPNVFIVTVSAVNVLGKGKGNDIAISIVEQSATESASEITSMLGTPVDPQQNNLLYQVVIPCAVVLAILLVIGCILALVFHTRKTAVARKTASDLSCSENVAYDTVGNTNRMTTQENVSCSDNIAYANLNRQERIITSTSTGRAAYYEEVEFKE